MALIRKCDRCGDMMGDSRLKLTTLLMPEQAAPDNYSETIGAGQGQQDLCKSCAVSFRRWWKETGR